MSNQQPPSDPERPEEPYGQQPPYGEQPPYGQQPPYEQQQPYGAPGYGPPGGGYGYGGPPPVDPGRTLGIVGIVLGAIGLCCGLSAIAGLIVSIIGFQKSKNAGFKNNLALAGIIVSAVMIVAGGLINYFYAIPALEGMN